MMTKEDVFKTLTWLSGTYGAGSFGYLPHLFAAKWLVDNRSSKEFQHFAERFAHFAECEDLERIACDVFCMRSIHVVRYDVSSGLEPFTALDESVSCEDLKKIIAYTCEALSALDFSEANVSRETLLEGFDMFLESCLDEAHLDIPVHPGPAEQIIAGISSGNGRLVSSAYNPFCRFGALLSAVSAEHKEADAEEWVYSAVAFVRSLFAGSCFGEVFPGPAIEDPLLSDDGSLKQFPLVVSDLSGVFLYRRSSVFQMDVHERFKELCPNVERLTASTAFCHAFASTASGGRCIVMCDGECRYGRAEIFGPMSDSGAKGLVLGDFLEAVIDVAVPSRVLRDVSGRFDGCTLKRKIFVFSKGKDAARRGKVLFVNAGKSAADEAVVSKVVSCVNSFSEIPGFSKVVDSKDVIGYREHYFGEVVVVGDSEVLADAAWFTAVPEVPESEDLCRIVRDLRQSEDERVSLMKDIEGVSAELAVMRG